MCRRPHCPLGGIREASLLGEMAPPHPAGLREPSSQPGVVAEVGWGHPQGPADKMESCEKPNPPRAPPQVAPFRDSQMGGQGPQLCPGSFTPLPGHIEHHQ